VTEAQYFIAGFFAGIVCTFAAALIGAVVRKLL
jgi:hypothetical protein